MSSSWTILMTCWAGLSALRELLAEAALADPGDEALDDREVDVGLEQGEADLAQDLVDVGLAEPPLAAEAPEDAVEAVGECLEHGSEATGRRSSAGLGGRRTEACSSTPTTPGDGRGDPARARRGLVRGAPRRVELTTARPRPTTSGWGRCQVRGAWASSNADLGRPRSGRRPGSAAASRRPELRAERRARARRGRARRRQTDAEARQRRTEHHGRDPSERTATALPLTGRVPAVEAGAEGRARRWRSSSLNGQHAPGGPASVGRGKVR